MNSPPELSHAALFNALQQLLDELYQKLRDRFELHPQPAVQPLQTYQGLDDSLVGSLQTFTGSEIDWLVYSWLYMPEKQFGTIRLTTWLGPQIQVPHLVFGFGATPGLFFYMDYVPRIDVWSDIRYTERFYEPMNSTYLALREHPDWTLLISKQLYVRQFQSPAHLFFRGQATDGSLALLRSTAHEICARWLMWVDEAEPVPQEAQLALAERDLRMRRISIERDTDTALVANYLGPELTERLIKALWDKQWS